MAFSVCETRSACLSARPHGIAHRLDLAVPVAFEFGACELVVAAHELKPARVGARRRATRRARRCLADKQQAGVLAAARSIRQRRMTKQQPTLSAFGEVVVLARGRRTILASSRTRRASWWC